MEDKPNYYAIIPADVRYNPNINANVKLLYGEISSLSNKYGYCIATNDYFSRLYNVSTRTITDWIKALEDMKYLQSEIETKRYEDGTIKKLRKLYINHIEVSRQNHIEDSLQNHIEENFSYNNTSNINNKENNNTTTDTIYDYLEENGFMLTPIQYEVVSQWEDNELTRYAIKKAVLNNKFNINYIDKILNSYEKQNIKTLQQAMANDEEFNTKRENYYKNKYEHKESRYEREKRIMKEWLEKDEED